MWLLSRGYGKDCRQQQGLAGDRANRAFFIHRIQSMIPKHTLMRPFAPPYTFLTVSMLRFD
jgi:hypothetical protein